MCYLQNFFFFLWFSLSSLKVPVIKAIAQLLGLKQSGKKSILVERILAYAATSEGHGRLASGLSVRESMSSRGGRRRGGGGGALFSTRNSSSAALKTSTNQVTTRVSFLIDCAVCIN